jgi:hypothetical protein
VTTNSQDPQDRCLEPAARLQEDRGAVLAAHGASPDRVAAGIAIDAGDLLPDTASINSWTRRVHEIEPMEMLEVRLCNQIAPFILVSRLRRASCRSSSRMTFRAG